MVTKDYIKKCEKAGEIQELWRPGCGDWMYFTKTNKILLITFVGKEMVEYVESNKEQERDWCYKSNIKTYLCHLSLMKNCVKVYLEEVYIIGGFLIMNFGLPL